MRNLLVLAVLALASCKDDSDSGDSAPLPAPVTHAVYDSGDLGILLVNGTSTQATARFTLQSDQIPVTVTVEADYFPAAGNTGGASCELWLYDTKADVDPNNDTLVGVLPVSAPTSRANLSTTENGSFTIRTPIGSASSDRVVKCGGTYEAQLRVNTSSGWNGQLAGLRVFVATVKGAQVTFMPSIFVRDN